MGGQTEVTPVDLLAASFEIDLNPDGALNLAWTVLLLLVVAYVLFQGAHSLSGSVASRLWPTLCVVFFAVVIMAFTDVRGDGDDTIRVTVETDRLAGESVSADGAQADGDQADGESFTHSHPVEHTHSGPDGISGPGVAPHIHPDDG